MSLRTKKIPKKKVKLVEDLKDLIKKNKTILVVSIRNIPASKFQEIAKKLRGKAVVKVPKKSLINRAIEESGRKEIKKLEENIDESFAILFSNEDAFDLASELSKTKSPAKAKAGQEAPEDIEIQEGPTDLPPGPAISELGAVGLQVKVDKGKLTIQESKVVVKGGEEIKPAVADVLGKLDIKPFSIGFTPLGAFDTEEKKYFGEIKIDTEGYLEQLKQAYSKAIPFALEIGYITSETMKIMIQKAGAHANKINRIITGEPEPVAETPTEEPKEEESKETKQEESEANAGEGLSALFG
jgi:large subunit ribosomal protein L10